MTTLGYTLATVFLYFAVFRYDMLGTKELASDFVIDRVSDGVIITDENGEVEDFNQRARAILSELETNPHKALSEILSLLADNKVLEADGKKYTPKENLLKNMAFCAVLQFYFWYDII